DTQNPSIIAQTNAGEVYFCTEEEAKVFQDYYKKLTADEEKNAVSNPFVFTEDSFNVKSNIQIKNIFENALYLSDDLSSVVAPFEEIPPIAPAEEILEVIPVSDQPEKQVNEVEEQNPLEQIFNQLQDIFDEDYESETDEILKNVDEESYAKIIESAGDKFYYYGEVDEDGNRKGYGRTSMENGRTAYEGEYFDDKRNGFGTFYFRSGKICYVGDWKSNRKNGTGVSFDPNDGSIQVGKWENGELVSEIAKFDKDGNIINISSAQNNADEK
ncbi:MAG: hypothetical protein Q8876_07020, partial [Bacillota bacterium]|nr:hypothetical protein [Bacillota bacterium]